MKESDTLIVFTFGALLGLLGFLAFTLIGMTYGSQVVGLVLAGLLVMLVIGAFAVAIYDKEPEQGWDN